MQTVMMMITETLARDGESVPWPEPPNSLFLFSKLKLQKLFARVLQYAGVRTTQCFNSPKQKHPDE